MQTSTLNLNTLSEKTLRQLCEETGFLTGSRCEMVQRLRQVDETVVVRVLARLRKAR